MLVFGAGNVAYSVVPALQAVNEDRGAGGGLLSVIRQA